MRYFGAEDSPYFERNNIFKKNNNKKEEMETDLLKIFFQCYLI